MVLSAGLLPWRPSDDGREVFVAHMGGPFWRTKPQAWSIVKGLVEADEDPWVAARREFAEEIGVPAPDGPVVDLGEVRQSSGKRVRVFGVLAPTFDVEVVRSNTVRLELPRGSGRFIDVPEVDDARWFPIAEAREHLVAGQVAALDALLARTSSTHPDHA